MKVVTFGEIMLRLKTPENLRIMQSDDFEASYGGAEANVAVSLAMYEDQCAFVSKVPNNPVGMSALSEVRHYGVNTEYMLRGGDRLGIYFFEKGSDIRSTNVVYDRAFSAFSLSQPSEYHWENILEPGDVFYFSGVTPAVSKYVEDTVRNALKYCKENDIQVICDLNYRGKMWSKEQAQVVMRDLMQYVDVCIANDEDFEATLGIHAFDGNLSTGIDQIDTYKEGMLEITRQFPNVKSVTSVLRNMHTVEEGDWMGIYYVDGKFYQSPIHRVHSLEAVGAGDAYGAAFVHGLINGFDPQKTVDFAISASVLKLMIQHDFNVVTQEDVFKIMNSKNTNLSR